MGVAETNADRRMGKSNYPPGINTVDKPDIIFQNITPGHYWYQEFW